MAREPGSFFVPLWKGKVLVGLGNSPKIVFLPSLQLGEILANADETLFLGINAHRQAVFACDISSVQGRVDGPYLGPGMGFVNLRETGPLLPREDAGLLAYAKGLLHWHARNRFCGVCGALTRAEESGHKRRCSKPSCDNEIFPRLDPAVIMLVTDGDRILLGRQPRWPLGMYSILAGFVENGEGIEEAVIREVKEETGVSVGNVRYITSQAWPFPSSLMLGFYAKALTTEVNVDGNELEDARWFSRAEVNNFAAQDKFLPRPDSISRFLIDGWLKA